MLITNEFLPNPKILKDVEILVVDNDRDSRDLYTFLLESYGAQVRAIDSVKGALELLNSYTPAILICEMRFLGERVYPLIQQVRTLVRSNGRKVPILATSTYAQTSLTQQWNLRVDAYLVKPIDIDYLVNEVWNLTLLPNIAYPPNLQAWVTNQTVDEATRDITLSCANGLGLISGIDENLFSMN
jgi:CheY-like chemotaxis protein